MNLKDGKMFKVCAMLMNTLCRRSSLILDCMLARPDFPDILTQEITRIEKGEDGSDFCLFFLQVVCGHEKFFSLGYSRVSTRSRAFIISVILEQMDPSTSIHVDTLSGLMSSFKDHTESLLCIGDKEHEDASMEIFYIIQCLSEMSLIDTYRSHMQADPELLIKATCKYIILHSLLYYIMLT